MRSTGDGSKPSHSKPANAFSSSFLRRLGERDEPPTADEADVAGPWRIVPIPGHGFGLFREGESRARGFMPTAVFPDRFLALVAAAVLPGTGRDPMLRLAKDEDADGFYPVTLKDRQVVGQFQLFNEPLLDAMNNAVRVLGSPASSTSGCRRSTATLPSGEGSRRCGGERGSAREASQEALGLDSPTSTQPPRAE